ncbi:MAG: hypothetical protein HOP09_12550 [Hyphomicrobium sp.]|nr:hypothetical protein [Hyphomicrobium sp.]
MREWMWIIAGPNSAGKSTFTNDLLASTSGLKKLNADERTRGLRTANPKVLLRALNLRAAREIDAEVAASIEAGESFLVETVLSSDTYRDDVRAAKHKGFKISLVYESLHPPELSPDRVATRVAKGGHDADRQTAIDRHARSHVQLASFAARADVPAVYDNSRNDAVPRLIAERAEDQQLRVPAAGINPGVDKALGIDRPVRMLKRPRTRDPS